MKKILCSLLIFAAPMLVLAQRSHMENIESTKIAWITQKLDLSVEEAKIFWPIYNDYQKEQATLRREQMKNGISTRKTTEIDELSDIEVQNLITKELAFRQRDLNIEKRYYNKFKTALPIKTLGKFYRAQETFKKELLNRFKGGPRKF